MRGSITPRSIALLSVVLILISHWTILSVSELTSAVIDYQFGSLDIGHTPPVRVGSIWDTHLNISLHPGDDMYHNLVGPLLPIFVDDMRDHTDFVAFNLR